jgi:hypothetical protein
MSPFVTATIAVFSTLFAAWGLLSLYKIYSVTAPTVPTVTPTGNPGTRVVTVTQALTINLGSQVDHVVCFLYANLADANNSQPTDQYGMNMSRTAGTNTWTLMRTDPNADLSTQHYAVVWVYWYNPIPLVPLKIIFNFDSGPSNGFTPP